MAVDSSCSLGRWLASPTAGRHQAQAQAQAQNRTPQEDRDRPTDPAEKMAMAFRGRQRRLNGTLGLGFGFPLLLILLMLFAFAVSLLSLPVSSALVVEEEISKGRRTMAARLLLHGGRRGAVNTDDYDGPTANPGHEPPSPRLKDSAGAVPRGARRGVDPQNP
ncbi:hypothetical protein Dimus_009248 [Dionaea muscipula]